MAMWQMIYSAGQGRRVLDAAERLHGIVRVPGACPDEVSDMMMMHPGMSMSEPVQTSHLLVGGALHFTLSAVVGIAFALILWELARAGLGAALGTYGGYVAASIAGGAILYFVMWYLVLPWANAPFKDLALKGRSSSHISSTERSSGCSRTRCF
jgi:hypothetical protein